MKLAAVDLGGTWAIGVVDPAEGTVRVAPGGA